MKQLQRVAALASIGAAIWPQDAEGWMAPNRRHAGSSDGFESSLSMLETQWGSPYTEIPVLRTDYNTLEFYFSRVAGESEAAILAKLQAAVMDDSENISPEDEALNNEPYSCSLTGWTLDKTASTLLQTIQGMEVETECQDLCGQLKGCSLATFEGALCSLYGKIKGLQRGTGSILPNSCDDTCFKKGKRFVGEALSLGKTPNPHICHSMCQVANGCVGFSWDRETQVCSSYKTEVEMETAAGVISGPRDPCVLNIKPSDYAGPMSLADGLSGNAANDKEVENIPNEYACRRMCMIDLNCNWFTYNLIDKKCYLKRTSGAVVVAKKGDKTSFKLADSSCYMRNVEYSDSSYSTPKKEYIHECVYTCYTDKKCKRWSYNTNTKICRLYSGDGVARSNYNAFNSFSGPKEGCGSEPLHVSERYVASCAARGVRYDGTPLDAFSSKDSMTCQASCIQSPVCEAYSFDIKAKICYIHLASAINRKKINYNFISGARRCGGCFAVGQQYNGANVIKELTTGFESPEECQLLCQATEGCTLFNYLGDRCILMSGETTKTSNPLATCGPKLCTPQCDLKGYQAPMRDYGYMKSLTGKTVEECRAACQADTSCTNFTAWDDQEKRCFLKDEESLRLLSPSEKATTGFTSCSDCFVQGKGIKPKVGTLLWNVEAYNPEECRWRCELMSSCTLFSYNAKSKQCTLLSGEGEVVEGDYYVSGPERCTPDRSCKQENTNFVGGETLETTQTTTLDACQDLCARNYKCEGVSFNGKKCLLLAGLLKAQEAKGWVSIPKKCYKLMSLCEEQGIDYPRAGLKTYNDITSLKDCSQICFKEPRCRIYDFNTDRQTCGLKTIAAAGNRKTTKPCLYTGSKYGCARCVRTGIKYVGTTFKTLKDFTHETACQLACEYYKKCIAFTFNYESKTCTLKSSVDSVVEDANSLSGPKKC